MAAAQREISVFGHYETLFLAIEARLMAYLETADARAHKVLAAQALNKLIGELKKVDAAQSTRAQSLMFQSMVLFLSNSEVMADDFKQSRLRDNVGKLLPSLLEEFADMGIGGFPVKNKIKDEIKDAATKAIAFCQQKQQAQAYQFSALDNKLLTALAVLFQQLLSKDKYPKDLPEAMRLLATSIGALLAADLTQQTAAKQIKQVFRALNQCINNGGEYFSNLRNELLDQLLSDQKIDQTLAGELVPIINAVDVKTKPGLVRMQQLFKVSKGLADLPAAKQQAGVVLQAVGAACDQYVRMSGHSAHKILAAQLLMQVIGRAGFTSGVELLDFDDDLGAAAGSAAASQKLPLVIAIRLLQQFLSHTDLQDKALVYCYSSDSYLTFGRQQKHKRAGAKVVAAASQKHRKDEIGKLIPALLDSLRACGAMVVGKKEKATVLADINGLAGIVSDTGVVRGGELGELANRIDTSQSDHLYCCIDFFGQVFYFQMVKGTQRSVSTDKLSVLGHLANAVLDFLSNLTYDNFVNIFVIINECITKSRATGTGAESTRLERIVTEFRDRLLNVAIRHNLGFMPGIDGGAWRTLYGLTCEDGRVTRHASELIDKLVEASLQQVVAAGAAAGGGGAAAAAAADADFEAPRVQHEDNQARGLVLRKQYLAELMPRIFTRQSTKSDARFAPFNLQAYLVRHAAVISKALQVLLTDAATLASQPALKTYAHVFNCALIEQLKQCYSVEQYPLLVRRDPLAKRLINPLLYNKSGFADGFVAMQQSYQHHLPILAIEIVQEKYQYANLQPSNPQIHAAFNAMMATLIARNPFRVYSLLNRYQAARQENPAIAFVVNDKHDKDIDFKLMAVLFVLDNLPSEAKSRLDDELQAQLEQLRRLFVAWEGKNFQGGADEASDVTACVAIIIGNVDYLRMLNPLVNDYLDQCGYLPHHYQAPEAAVENQDIWRKFPGQKPLSARLHVNQDGPILVHQGPTGGNRSKESDHKISVINMLLAFVELPAEQRPTATLALGGQGDDFAIYYPINDEIQDGGVNYKISTTQEKNSALCYQLCQGDTLLLRLKVYNIELTDNKPLVLTQDARDRLHYIFEHNSVVSIHCASGVGRTGTANMIYQGARLIQALNCADPALMRQAMEFSQLGRAPEQLTKFALLAPVLRPFNIYEHNVTAEQCFARAQFMMRHLPDFKLGMEKLCQGEPLASHESSAIVVIVEQLLHARRRERYSVQEALQLQSAVKEMVMYYAKVVLKFKPDRLASLDNSIIISDTFTDFRSGFSVPQKALTAVVKPSPVVASAASAAAAANPFDGAGPDHSPAAASFGVRGGESV